MLDMILAAPTRWYILAVVVFVLDQSTKWWVGYTFSYGEVVNVAPVLNFTLVYNTGAAFSFLSDAGGWQRWFLSLLASAISLGLIYWIYQLPKQQLLLPSALGLILGGALGNLVDRLLFGYVVDFIDLYYRNYHWPAFNLADAAICLGAGLLLLDAFRKPSQRNAPGSGQVNNE